MTIVGKISKMIATAAEPFVQYSLPIGDKQIFLNDFLGKKLAIEFTEKIICSGCGKTVKKSYQQGYCFPCTQRLAQCDLCILKPERCHYHLNTCREPTWGESHCMIPHYVYLANTTGLKVGITRASQVPTRWLDQGAVAALPIIQVPTRRLSGLIEVLFAQQVSDKTDWRKMLQGGIMPIDLYEAREVLFDKLLENFQNLKLTWGEEAIVFVDQTVMHFEYPVLEYPKKITSLSWDQTSLIEGTLLGIKGQYLIFDKGVINIRKYAGYVVKI